MPVNPYTQHKRRKALRRFGGSHAKAATAIQRAFRKRRATRVPKTMSLARAGVGLPSQLIMKHQYRLNKINLVDTTLGYKQFIFKANSMYDPENPVGGLQPTLRDNLYQLYNWARVVGIKVKINFFNTGGQHCLVGCVLTSDASDNPFSQSGSNDPMAIPKDRASFSHVSEYQGSKTQTVVKKAYSFKHFDSDLYSSVNYRSDSSNDPAKLWYLIVGAQCTTNNDCNITAEVVIDYTVRWEQPINTEMATLD